MVVDMMRALVFLAPCFLVIAEIDEAKLGSQLKEEAQLLGEVKDEAADAFGGGTEKGKKVVRKCVMDGAEAVNDMIDSGVYLWAATQRCGKQGEGVKCEVDVATSAESINGMVNVVLRAAHQCNNVWTEVPKCGLAIGKMSKSAAGIAAASGAIYEKCPKLGEKSALPKQQILQANPFEDLPGEKWKHGRGATCMLDLKDTMVHIFKASRKIMRVKKACEEGTEQCAVNVLNLVSAFAGVGEFLMSAVGHCQHGWNITSDFECAAEVTGLLRRLGDVALAGKEMAEGCDFQKVFKSSDRKNFDLSFHPQANRLYDEEARDEPSSSSIGFATPVMAALLPLTAVVGFLVGARSRLGIALSSRSRHMNLIEVDEHATQADIMLA